MASPLEFMRVQHAAGRPFMPLREFAAWAWEIVEPATKLTWNWHLDALCDHLQSQIEAGKFGKPCTQNAVYNVPPGSMKSLIFSVFAPAWVWTWWPSWRAIYASANPRISMRDSMRCKDIIESEKYRETFAIKWALSEDQNSKGNYKNTRGGWRLAVTVNTKITGDRGDFLGVDDALDASDADSEAFRDAANYWYDNAWENRGNDLDTVVRAVIGQRLHEVDLPGYLLNRLSRDYEHVDIQCEFEDKCDCRSCHNAPPEREGKTWLGWRDPRTQKGELFFPERFPEKVLVKERAKGTRYYNGQYQQRPVAQGGNRFKRHWWNFYTRDGSLYQRPHGSTERPSVLMPRQFDEIILSWDCAFRGKETSDWVVGLVLGRIGQKIFVLEMVRKRMGFAETRREVVAQFGRWTSAYATLVEGKANGDAIVDDLIEVIPGLIGVDPEGGKESRAAALEPSVEAGQWYLPEHAPWVGDWVDEFAAFPAGGHDDIVDAASQGGLYLRDSGVANTMALLGLTPASIAAP